MHKSTEDQNYVAGVQVTELYHKSKRLGQLYFLHTLFPLRLNQSLNFSKTVWLNSLSGKCIESNSFFKNVACVSLGIHERCTKFPRNLCLFLHGRKRDVPVISIVLYYLFLFTVDIKYCRMLNQT